MLNEILSQRLWDNSVIDYLFAVGIFIVGLIIVKIAERILFKRLKKWSENTATTLDDFIVNIVLKIVLPLLYFGIFYLSMNSLNLIPLLDKIVNFAGVAFITLSVARLTTVIISYGFNIYWQKRGKDLTLQRSLNGIVRVLKLAVWSLAVIFFLDNLGFKISAVIAGLGIGGVAVALAAQAVLGDLFSYFAILFDRPFEIGDFIITGDYLGTIEHIGIKTTRVRSLSGEQLVFSNTDLTNSRIHNYKRMDKRRVLFRLGVTYQTKLDQLKMIPGAIENIIKNIEDTVFDRAHFFSFADFNLVIEVVYYVIGNDYNKYMDIQQKINFAIKKEFEARGIEFAYPTQTLYVNKA